ncbi:MAG: hypothetical protein QOK45_2792 [Mycobacterium sp.]|jgi:hypothetical protein|nr:hypothetical protein [Mycobacterium sp.]
MSLPDNADRARQVRIITRVAGMKTFAGHNWRTLVSVCDWPGPGLVDTWGWPTSASSDNEGGVQ